jgi:uncharacterized membrane protein YiaA
MKNNISRTGSRDDTLIRLCSWAIVVGIILLIPLLSNAPWTVSDYVFSGLVLSVCALGYVFSTKNSNNGKRKVAIGAGILFFIFLVIGWAASGP